MAIQVNTAAITSAADQIDAANKKIRDELSAIDSALKTLQKSWEGEASKSCVSQYDHIKRSFSEERYSVVNGLVLFMRNQVGAGYETTEKSVSSAASAFK